MNGSGIPKPAVIGGLVVLLLAFCSVAGVLGWKALFDEGGEFSVADIGSSDAAASAAPAETAGEESPKDAEVAEDADTPRSQVPALFNGFTTSTVNNSTADNASTTKPDPSTAATAAATNPAAAMASGSPATSAASDPTSPIVEGDRSAWLTANGTGFSRIGDIWMYYGPAADVPFHPVTGATTATFPLIETMRTPQYVELYDPAQSTRIRVDSSRAVAYLPGHTTPGEHHINGGAWQHSTRGVAWRGNMQAVDTSDYALPDFSASADLPQLISAVERNVVRIDVKSEDGEGNGSGFLLDASGRVVTNYHVIEGASKSSVVFKGEAGGGDTRLPVDGFLHVDPKRDIAILQVTLPDTLKRSGLRTAARLPRKGASVVAFGAPLGLDFSASEGIVSGYRSAEELEQTLGIDGSMGQWVQTTAPISPGNSGGPLVHRETGEVVAINTMTLTIGQSLNFGISCEDIRDASEKSSLRPTPLTPASVPVIIARRGSGRSGSADSGETIDVLPGGIRIVDIQDTELADELLAKLDELQFVVIVEPYNAGARLLEGLLRDYVREALDPVDVRLVLDEGPVMLLVGKVSGERLEIVAHVYAPDSTSRTPRIVRMWRGAGDMGQLTDRMFQRKRLFGDVDRNLTALFAELTEIIRKAKHPESTADEKE